MGKKKRSEVKRSYSKEDLLNQIFQKVQDANRNGRDINISVSRKFLNICDVDDGCKTLLGKWSSVVDLTGNEVLKELNEVKILLDERL